VQTVDLGSTTIFSREQRQDFLMGFVRLKILKFEMGLPDHQTGDRLSERGDDLF
jgi:hypothetical protein